MAPLGCLAARRLLRGLGGPGSVTVALDDGMATLTIANQAQKNALSPLMMAQLADCVDEVEQRGASVLIMRGQGNTFSAGASLEMFDQRSHEELAKAGAAMEEVMVDTCSRIFGGSMISVSCIEGYAVGGGAELATSTDFRVWSSNAMMRFVQARMGLSPGWGGGRRLAQLVGRTQALRLLGSCKPVSADEALQIGLADKVAPTGAHEAGVQFLEGFRSQPYPAALAAAKRIVSTASDSGDSETEKQAFLSLWAGPDNLDAVGRARGQRKVGTVR